MAALNYSANVATTKGEDKIPLEDMVANIGEDVASNSTVISQLPEDNNIHHNNFAENTWQIASNRCQP